MLQPEAHRSRPSDGRWQPDWPPSHPNYSMTARHNPHPPPPSHYSNHGYAPSMERPYSGTSSTYAGGREAWSDTWTGRPIPPPTHHNPSAGPSTHPNMHQTWDPPRHPARYEPAATYVSGRHSPGYDTAMRVKYHDRHEARPVSWAPSSEGRPPYGDSHYPEGASRHPPPQRDHGAPWWPQQPHGSAHPAPVGGRGGEAGRGTWQAENVRTMETFMSRYTVGHRPNQQDGVPVPPVYVPHRDDYNPNGPRVQPPGGYPDGHVERGRKYSHTINDICHTTAPSNPEVLQTHTDRPPLQRAREGESPPHLPLPGVKVGGNVFGLTRATAKRVKMDSVAVSAEESRRTVSKDSDSTSTEEVQRPARKKAAGARSHASLKSTQLSRDERGRQVVDRRRRHNTKQCLDELQTLLPALADGPRANSTTVLQAAVDYLRTLTALTGTGAESTQDEWPSIVLDKAGALWLLVDDDAIVLQASADCVALLGGEEQVVGRSLVDLVEEEDQAQVAVAVQRGGRATVYLADTATDRGPFVFSARSVTVAETDSLYHVVTFSQPELKLYLDAYFELPTHTDEMISHHLPSGITTYATSNIRSLFGYPPDEFIGVSPYKFYHMDDMQRIILSHKGVVADQRNSVIYRFLTRTSGHVWVKTTAQLILGSDGQPADIMCRTRLTACLDASVLADRADHQQDEPIPTVTPRDFGAMELRQFIQSIERENGVLKEVLHSITSGQQTGGEAGDAPSKKAEEEEE